MFVYNYSSVAFESHNNIVRALHKLLEVCAMCAKTKLQAEDIAFVIKTLPRGLWTLSQDINVNDEK